MPETAMIPSLRSRSWGAGGCHSDPSLDPPAPTLNSWHGSHMEPQRAGQRALWVRVLAAIPDNLSSIPRTRREGDSDLWWSPQQAGMHIQGHLQVEASGARPCRGRNPELGAHSQLLSPTAPQFSSQGVIAPLPFGAQDHSTKLPHHTSPSAFA